MDNNEEKAKPFDKFELAAAILLGLGAVGASVASYQEGLWGGQSVEAYGEAAAMTTKASTTYNDELTTYMQDVQADRRIKELIWEASESEDDNQAARWNEMASWMLLTQISEQAYKALGQTPEAREKYDADGDFELSEKELDSALNTDLDDDYVNAVFSDSEDEFDAADARFKEGRDANNRGDEFSLAGVILTVSLFFAGLALVFKTNVRWGFLGVGSTVFAAGLGYMLTLTWA